MKKWILVTVVVAVASIAAVSFIPAALADGPTDSYGFGYGRGPMFSQNVGYGQGQMANPNFDPGARLGPRNADAPRFGLGFGWGGPEHSLVAVAAEQLGLTRADLISELQSGQTIADVAAEKSVALDTIVEVFIAPRAEQLATQVNNGQLTQEQADAMLATMRANVTARLSEDWTPRGPGLGQGFVDEDGDGVGDNAGAGRGPGRGYGPNFVDEDGDGVCDNAASGASFGRQGGVMGRGWQQNSAN
jgi:hypothetical protein